jgi:hypothetical protein
MFRGKVFDVTAGKDKYIGTGYQVFLGRDASRSFATGCLDDVHQWTPDLRGITKSQQQHLEQWVRYYEKHPDYYQVGTVKIVEPTGPIPGKCSSPAPGAMPHQGKRPGSSHY